MPNQRSQESKDRNQGSEAKKQNSSLLSPVFFFIRVSGFYTNVWILDSGFLILVKYPASSIEYPASRKFFPVSGKISPQLQMMLLFLN